MCPKLSLFRSDQGTNQATKITIWRKQETVFLKKQQQQKNKKKKKKKKKNKQKKKKKKKKKTANRINIKKTAELCHQVDLSSV